MRGWSVILLPAAIDEAGPIGAAAGRVHVLLRHYPQRSLPQQHRCALTTQLDAQIQPRQFKQAVNFYESKALEALRS